MTARPIRRAPPGDLLVRGDDDAELTPAMVALIRQHGSLFALSIQQVLLASHPDDGELSDIERVQADKATQLLVLTVQEIVETRGNLRRHGARRTGAPEKGETSWEIDARETGSSGPISNDLGDGDSSSSVPAVDGLLKTFRQKKRRSR